MAKTKFGINPAFYAVLAFLLAFISGPVWVAVLTVFLIAAEQNEWAARQSIQALILSLISSVIGGLFGLAGFINKIPYLGDVWYWFEYSINRMVLIAVAIFCLIGFIKVIGGKEANLPIIGKIADWAYGKVAPKPQPVQQAQPQAQAPVQQAQAPVQQPQQPQQ